MLLYITVLMGVLLVASFIALGFVYLKRFQLEKEQGLFKKALDTVSLPIVLADGFNKCFYVNSAAKTILHYQEGDDSSRLAKLGDERGFMVLTNYDNNVQSYAP